MVNNESILFVDQEHDTELNAHQLHWFLPFWSPIIIKYSLLKKRYQCLIINYCI